MVRPEVIVIAGSAGALSVLRVVLRALPADLPAAVFALLHRGDTVAGVLERMLSDGLHVHEAEDGAPIRRGLVAVAPAGRHLSLDRNRMHVAAGPRIHGHRPSADILFLSAAESFGERAAGVVLSGALSDGAVGLTAIKDRGGVAIVQDPEEALYPSMPLSALRATPVDHTLRMNEIAPCLVKLCT